MLPQLMPLGQWPALILTGVIWGLWHLPIFATIPYPLEPPIVGLLLFVVFATIWGHPARLDAPRHGQPVARGARACGD
jgi:membrane protease YdiL (CAAX protease family)